MWSRNKANLYIQDALNDFHYDPKALPSPVAQRKIYRNKLMITHLTGFGGGVSGVAGTSYYFDGIGDKLTSPEHANWQLGGGGGNFTIDLWIRLSAVSNNGMVSQREDDENHWGFYFDSNGINFAQQVADSVTINIAQGSSAGWSTNIWYHVALIRGWSGNANDYALTRDGAAVKTETEADALADFTGEFNIGWTSFGNWYTDGYIDEFRISNTARWTADFSASLPTVAYTSDANTHLLIHCDETIKTGSTGSGATFDDSGNTTHEMTENSNAIRSSAQFKF